MPILCLKAGDGGIFSHMELSSSPFQTALCLAVQREKSIRHPFYLSAICISCLPDPSLSLEDAASSSKALCEQAPTGISIMCWDCRVDVESLRPAPRWGKCGGAWWDLGVG